MISGPITISGPLTPCGRIPAQSESLVSLKRGDVVQVIQAFDAGPQSGYLTLVVDACLSVWYVGNIGREIGWMIAGKLPRNDKGVSGWVSAENVMLRSFAGQFITLKDFKRCMVLTVKYI